MFRLLLALLSSLLCNCSWVKTLFKSPDKTKSQYIIDSKNRIIIYHGVNISNYSKDSEGQVPWQTSADFAKMKEWGFNFVRYLVFWESVEPTKGVYNQKYIDELKSRLAILRDLDIDVVIDMHQDLYAKRFGGNGAPPWAIKDNGLPFTPREPWFKNYLEPAVLQTYTNFWNSEELQNHYISALTYVLDAVKEFPNVLGVDIMNEPFPGKVWNFERSVLSKFYKTVQDKTDTLFRNNVKSLFFEPMIYTSAGIPSALKFKTNPYNVYFPHYYDKLTDDGYSYGRFNRRIMNKAAQIKVFEAQKLGVPLMYGEFGSAVSVKNYLTYMKDFLDITDDYCVGWAYWSYDPQKYNDFGIVDNNNEEMEIMKLLVRIYPQKIAGRNPFYRTGGNTFTLSYDMATNCREPTEIFIPKGLTEIRITLNGRTLIYSGERIFAVHNDLSSPKQIIRISWK